MISWLKIIHALLVIVALFESLNAAVEAVIAAKWWLAFYFVFSIVGWSYLLIKTLSVTYIDHERTRP